MQPTSKRRQRRALVVDDSQAVRRYHAALLARAGFDRVDTADDGAAGLDRAADDDGYDLYLVDVNMPRLDGVSMVRALRERGCTSRILMVSTEAAAAADCLAAGADGYLVKPLSAVALGAALAAQPGVSAP